MNTYQEVLITCGYNDACVYAYLLNMADENGDFTTSVAQLSDITGLTPKQLRTILVRLERANVTANKRTNGGTTITICKSDSYKHSRRSKGQTKRQAEGQTKRQIKEKYLIAPDKGSHTLPINPLLSPKETHSLSACERFAAWLSSECPYIATHLKPITDAELDKLKQQFSTEAIMEVCHEMENRKDLRKRYTNLYRTLLNWLKKRNENNRTTHPSTREERLREAAHLIQRMGEEADNTVPGLDQLFE